MKFIGKLVNWIILPAIFALAIVTDDLRYAQAGSALLWAIALFIGPVSLVMLVGCLSMKPGHPKWEKNKQTITEGRSWPVTKVVSWALLFITVALCAFTGFIVTAIFYLIAVSWARLSWALLESHFKDAEPLVED